HHTRGGRLDQRDLGRDDGQEADGYGDDYGNGCLYGLDTRPQLHGRLLLVVVRHLLGTLANVTRLGAAPEARERHRREDAARIHGANQLGTAGDHHRHRDRLDLVLHVLVAARLGGDLDHADVLAGARIEDGENTAENFN